MKNKLLILMGVLLMMAPLFGCNSKEEIITGGRSENNDESAAKEILSKDIVDFSVSFFVYLDEPLDDDYSGQYEFKIEDKILSENKKFKISEKIDDSVLERLQAIIDKYELVKLNGTNAYTAGLAPEYQPYYLEVKYASGEELKISDDNDPDALWAKEMAELFRETFISLGHDELNASKEATTIVNFQIEFNIDDLGYSFSPVLTSVDETKLLKITENLDEASEITEIANIDDELYEGLVKLLIELNLKQLQIDSIAMDNECPHTKNGYYVLNIEFENGKHLYTYSTDSELVKKFSESSQKLLAYFDEYMENHGKTSYE